MVAEEVVVFFWGGGIFLTLLGILWLAFHKSPFLYQALKRDKHDRSTYYQKYGEDSAIKVSLILGIVLLIAGLVLLFLGVANYLQWF